MAAIAPFGTDLQPQFEVKVRGGRVVHVVKQRGHASPKAHGAPSPRRAARSSHVQRGRPDAHTSPALRLATEPRDKMGEERERPNLPDVVDRAALGAAGITSEGSRERTRRRRRRREVTISDATARQQVKEVLSILQPRMHSARQLRERTLDSIHQVCAQSDSRCTGILKNAVIARAFLTCGARVSEEGVRRLSKLTGSGGEGDFTLYHILCTALKRALHEREGEAEDTKMAATQCPHSISPSSSSATGHKSSLLSDASAVKTASSGEEGASNEVGEQCPQHTHGSWSPPRSHVREVRSHSEGSCEQDTVDAGQRSGCSWVTCERRTELLQAVGFECLKRALQSWGSDDGLVESDQALWLVKMYTLLYNLPMSTSTLKLHLLHHPSGDPSYTPIRPLLSYINSVQQQ